MEIEPEEKKIVELLTKLKDRGGNYPKNLLESRRQMYLGQIASIGAGAGIGAGIQTVAKGTKAGAPAHVPGISASSLIESILVVAIVVQAGIVAYNYRDVIARLFNPNASTPTVVSTGPSMPDTGPVWIPTMTAVSPTDTQPVTATVTPGGTLSNPGTGGGNITIQQGTAVAKTPTPKGDSGKHLGQTPKPPKPTQDTSNPKATKEKK